MVPSRNSGFTILELMIAITVFSIATMLVIFGVISVGKAYQQGSTKSKLLTLQREIHYRFVQELQYSGYEPEKATITNDGIEYSAICIGKTRYLTSVGTAPNYSENRFIIETISGSADCDVDTIVSENSINPLPSNAKVMKFDLTGDREYLLDTKFVIGERDMFIDDNYNNRCQSSVLGSQFCAIVELNSTSVQKVLN